MRVASGLGHSSEVLESHGFDKLRVSRRNSRIEQELTRFRMAQRDVWGLARQAHRRKPVAECSEDFCVEDISAKRPISLAEFNQALQYPNIHRFVLGEEGTRVPSPSPRIGVIISCYPPLHAASSGEPGERN